MQPEVSYARRIKEVFADFRRKYAKIRRPSSTTPTQDVRRGIRQSWDRPALQAGVDYGRPDGWRAGAWTSTVDKRFIDNGSLEIDAYAGYSRKDGDVGYSTKATWYHYPGARVAGSGSGFDYGELAAGLNFFGVPDARGTGYLDLSVPHEVVPVGRQRWPPQPDPEPDLQVLKAL